MKKCNFFPVLLVALFMSLGFAANAQYVSSVKAEAIVTDVVNNLKKDSNNASITSPANSGAASTMILNLKIKVGEAMIKPLHQGRTVGDAITSALAQVNVGNSSQRRQALNEVETFYKNRLKEQF